MELLIDGCTGACAGTGIEPHAKRRKIRRKMDNLAAPRYWIPPMATHPLQLWADHTKTVSPGPRIQRPPNDQGY